MKNAIIDLVLAILHGDSTAAFNPDDSERPANPPQQYAGNPWREWLWYLLTGEIPPGRYVYCGLSRIGYSASLSLVQQAADDLNVAYETDEDLETVAWRIVATKGSELLAA